MNRQEITGNPYTTLLEQKENNRSYKDYALCISSDRVDEVFWKVFRKLKLKEAHGREDCANKIVQFKC